MKLPNSRSKNFSLSQGEQLTSSPLTSLETDRITPPHKLNATVLQRKEDKDTRHRNASGEGSRDDVVVLAPESQVFLLQVHHAEPSDRYGGPGIGQVVGRPGDGAIHQNDGVDLAHPGFAGELLLRVVDDEGQDETDWETHKESGVLTSFAEDLVWTNGSP